MGKRAGESDEPVVIDGYSMKSLYQLLLSVISFGCSVGILALGFQWVENDWAFDRNRFFLATPIILLLSPVLFFQGLRSVNSFVKLSSDGEIIWRKWPHAPEHLSVDRGGGAYILFKEDKEGLYSVFTAENHNSELQKRLTDIRIPEPQKALLEGMSFVRIKHSDPIKDL